MSTDAPRTSSPLRVVGALASRVRDLWLILGLTAGVILALELGYRAQGSLRVAMRGEPALPPHPYADAPWYPTYVDEEKRASKLEWHPYTYFRRVPFSGATINVDSGGLRRTVQTLAAGPRRTVLLFGGSTMWGTESRDAGTIPSHLAAALRAHQVTDVELVNLGETGYVLAQEVTELMLRLRAGERPALVVFYDGINDAFSTLQHGRPGLPQNEQNRVREFALGRAVFHWATDTRSELSAAAHLGAAALSRSQLLRRLQGIQRPLPAGETAPLTEQLAGHYAETLRQVEALAALYDFRVLHVWQPSLHATAKPLTPWEQHLQGRIDGSAMQSQLRILHRGIPPMLRRSLGASARRHFVDLSTLFDAEPGPVFVDVIGHATESANARIADELLPSLLTLLRQ